MMYSEVLFMLFAFYQIFSSSRVIAVACNTVTIIACIAPVYQRHLAAHSLLFESVWNAHPGSQDYTSRWQTNSYPAQIQRRRRMLLTQSLQTAGSLKRPMYASMTYWMLRRILHIRHSHASTLSATLGLSTAWNLHAGDLLLCLDEELLNRLVHIHHWILKHWSYTGTTTSARVTGFMSYRLMHESWLGCIPRSRGIESQLPHA
jgi:hypothetical protein